MKAQTIFDTVVRHLAAQGKRAGTNTKDFDFYCKYRGPKGTKCAAGVLIKDEEYQHKMEGNTFDALAGFKKLAPKRLIEHSRLILRLQEAHDAGWSKYETAQRDAKGGIIRKGTDLVTELRKIAEVFDLNTTALDRVAPKFPEIWK